MDLEKIVKNSYSIAEVSRKLGYSYVNGSITKEIRSFIEKEGIDYTHFNKNGDSRRRYEHIYKVCPICGHTFETLKGHKKEKKTCSYSCSNTFFRSGPNNGGWKEDESCGSSSYRSTCFYYHKKECLICGEKNIVEVHHVDENRKNNIPLNLIPLCPTHHQYYHSRYKNMIEKQILNYIKQRRLA